MSERVPCFLGDRPGHRESVNVVEHVDMSVDEMQSILVRLIGHAL
jgi:hypothetical protein